MGEIGNLYRPLLGFRLATIFKPKIRFFGLNLIQGGIQIRLENWISIVQFRYVR